jgi:hypothetical protein
MDTNNGGNFVFTQSGDAATEDLTTNEHQWTPTTAAISCLFVIRNLRVIRGLIPSARSVSPQPHFSVNSTIPVQCSEWPFASMAAIFLK